MSLFKLHSEYNLSGDQGKAVSGLLSGLAAGKMSQVLRGVTGSGKTFTLANMISRLDRPVLVLSHNKTLAAQLYSEFKSFFPENAVEYFISYYDYYLPESYIPQTDTYIAKDASINENIERLRLSGSRPGADDGQARLALERGYLAGGSGHERMPLRRVILRHRFPPPR